MDIGCILVHLWFHQAGIARSTICNAVGYHFECQILQVKDNAKSQVDSCWMIADYLWISNILQRNLQIIMERLIDGNELAIPEMEVWM